MRGTQEKKVQKFRAKGNGKFCLTINITRWEWARVGGDHRKNSELKAS